MSQKVNFIWSNGIVEIVKSSQGRWSLEYLSDSINGFKR